MDEIEEVIKDLEEEVKRLGDYHSYYEVPVEEIIEKIKKLKKGLKDIEIFMEYKEID